jgi:hypothetical protein
VIEVGGDHSQLTPPGQPCEAGQQGRRIGAAREGDDDRLTALDRRGSGEESLEGLLEPGADSRAMVAVKGFEPLTQRI